MKVKQLLTRFTYALGVTTGLLLTGSPLMAQVKIGDNPNAINPNAVLELESVSKGLLQPRVALTSLSSASPLSAHVAGMRVYNTTENTELEAGEYYNDGSAWVKLTSNNNYNQVDGPNEPTGTCTNKTIYTDTLETSTTFGQQWRCIGGTWIGYKSPTKTPFYAGYSDNDAGESKKGLISRNGHIVTQRESNLGRSTIAPGGIIQLHRAPALGGNHGGALDLTNNINQPSRYRIGLRNDVGGALGGIAFQKSVNSPSPGFEVQMVVTNNGLVGIGTAHPKRPLHVHGAVLIGAEGVDGTKYADASSPTDGTMLVYGIAEDRAQIINQSSGARPNLILAKKAAVTDDPYVEFRVTAGLAGSIVRKAGLNIMYTATSDRRLKENIHATHYSIKDLMKIGVVDYNYKSDSVKTPIAGFIAQDLHKVFPDAVHVGGNDVKTKPWTVDYSKLTPLLVKAVQDQQEEIAALKAQLSEMNSLKAEVASIKAMLGNANQLKSEASISK